MNIRSISIGVLLITSGCSESEFSVKENVPPSPAVQLEKLIEESGEVTFYGWNGMQHNVGGAHFRLTFQKESKVELDTLGYNFVFAYGVFHLEEGSLIHITFDRTDAPPDNLPGYTTDWPLLKLTESEGRLQIHREDGKTAWHLDWPLYPEITGDLWPVSASIRSDEQDEAEQSSTPP